MKYHKLNAAVFTASLLLCSSYTWAGSGQYTLAQGKTATSKSQAAAIAKKQYGGKVLKIQEVNKGGKKSYKVRLILDNGKVKILTIAAQKGKAT